MQTIQEIENELKESIPITKHMGISLIKYDSDEIIITSNLDKHFNYQGTAFGGSLNTIALLPCYLMANKILKEQNLEFKSLVIQDSQVKYIKPVQANFKAICQRPDDATFTKVLLRKKTARIQIQSKIVLDNSEEAMVLFSGRFVAHI